MANKEFDNVLDMIFSQAKLQFGSAIKSRWVYGGDGCPGCGKPIDVMKYKKKKALSVNAYIFRTHGVLIAYFLCGNCGNTVIDAKSKTDIHSQVEKNLESAYIKSLGH